MRSGQDIEIERLSPVLFNVESADGRHLLVGDRDGHHRVFFSGKASTPGSVFLIPFDDDFGTRLHSLQRFRRRLMGYRAGSAQHSVLLSAAQRTRLAQQIRALDGAAAHATRREIATVLLSPEAQNIPAIEWKSSALRKQVNRLIAGAISLRNGGYLDLLRGDPARAARFRRRPRSM